MPGNDDEYSNGAVLLPTDLGTSLRRQLHRGATVGPDKHVPARSRTPFVKILPARYALLICRSQQERYCSGNEMLCVFESRNGCRLLFTQTSRGFPQFLQANSGILFFQTLTHSLFMINFLVHRTLHHIPSTEKCKL